MRHEAIALGVFILVSIALFSGILRRPGAGRILGIIVAVATAVYLIVALPLSLSPWAHSRHDRAHQETTATTNAAPVTTAAPVASVSPVNSDGFLVVALQTTFDATRAGLNALYRAATADHNRAVSDETVLQTIVGIVLTLLFTVFGFLGSAFRRAVSRSTP